MLLAVSPDTHRLLRQVGFRGQASHADLRLSEWDVVVVGRVSLASMGLADTPARLLAAVRRVVVDMATSIAKKSNQPLNVVMQQQQSAPWFTFLRDQLGKERANPLQVTYMCMTDTMTPESTSRLQCVFAQQAQGMALFDCNSMNGTWVNGQRAAVHRHGRPIGMAVPMNARISFTGPRTGRAHRALAMRPEALCPDLKNIDASTEWVVRADDSRSNAMESIAPARKRRAAEEHTDAPPAVRDARVDACLEEFECGVCLETMRDAASLPVCGHTFCARCIKDWLAVQRTCPICQKAVAAEPVRANQIQQAIRALVQP